MTPVTVLLATAALVGGVLTSVPAAADPPPDPVSGLVGGLVGPPREAHRQQERRDRGHTHAPDGVLRMGCHNYPYRYRLDVRTNDWTLETFLRDRRGETIASGAFFAGADRKRQRSVFRFCRYNTVPGRFTIRAKLHWYTDSGDHKTWLDPSHFRLRRP
jgi:hypothetical protein